MPKKIKRFVRVFVETPHITSWAASVLLRRQLMKQDDSFNWQKWVGWRNTVVRKVIASNIPLNCEYCGRKNLIPFPKKHQNSGMLTLDHLNPVSKSNNNGLSNLVLSCKSCNTRKSDRLPTEKEISKVRTIEFLLNSAGQLKTI